MIALRLDGRAEASRLLKQLKRRVAKHRRPITLATILVGQRYDSALYVKLKRKAAADVGIRTEPHQLSEKITQAQLTRLIQRLNKRPTVTGILLQLPLPTPLNADLTVAAIDPRKDVDGFHPLSRKITPPPVAAVLQLIAVAKPARRGTVVILGRASVFAQRLSEILERRGHEVVIENAPRRIPLITKQADIIVTALGRGPRLGASHIKRGAIIIDVGIRRQHGKTVGDVAPSAWTKARAISPVPGGVGPLTVSSVLLNTYQLTRL